MEEGIIKITPDKQKASSILKMVEKTIEMVKTIDKDKFPSNIIKEYYEILRELISVILLLDGYKTFGEGAHKKQIEYIKTNYEEINESEINLLEELRITRNKIAYDGFFIEKEYLIRKEQKINEIITKIKNTITKKE